MIFAIEFGMNDSRVGILWDFDFYKKIYEKLYTTHIH